MIQQNQSSLQNQVTQICNMCMALGIHKNVYQGQNKLLSHMPVSFYPYQISEETYEKLKKAHLIWARLILKVSKDKQFVNRVFAKTAKSDQFVQRFLDLYNKYISQEVFGANCLRVDYMGDQKPQLVEFNLMSVGLNGMSDLVQKLTILRQKHRSKDVDVFYPPSNNQVALLNSIETILKSQNLEGIALMVVHEKNQKQFNFGDQNAFELQALRRSIKVKRVSMTQFIKSYKLDQNNDLYLDSLKIAVVYFRTGYAPGHYVSQDHWKLRQNIQKANVLSIPSVSMQLINFKRMQVELSKIEVLRQYLSEQQALLLKSLNGEIYDFETPQSLVKLQKLASTNNYVLKSNREGGGNNYFGTQAANKINQQINNPGDLEKYVLMNKIQSQIRDNIFVANYKYLYIKENTCEYSTFGSFAYIKDQLVYNQYGGNLIRLKKAEQNEGGIAIDKAVISGLCVKKSHSKTQSITQ